ncbi:MAG TPA: hypothetical protein VHF47_07150 [Acidimicrobiales bacterium]|nr:hypothetical protein [Acidimicrobiales bacterium]
MRRAKRFVVAVAVIGTALGAFDGTVEAHTDTCSLATGEMAVGGGPAFRFNTGPFSSGGFNMSATASCSTGVTMFYASGSIGGWCDDGYGSGTTSDGHRFGFIWRGGSLQLAGEVDGTITVTPAITAGSSCTSGASTFFMQGQVVLHH